MREFIEYLATQTVFQPEEVKVEEIQEDDTYFIYRISVAPEDIAALIGTHGRNIKSIRSLARSKAILDGIKVSVDIVEPEHVEI